MARADEGRDLAAHGADRAEADDGDVLVLDRHLHRGVHGVAERVQDRRHRRLDLHIGQLQLDIAQLRACTLQIGHGTGQIGFGNHAAVAQRLGSGVLQLALVHQRAGTGAAGLQITGIDAGDDRPWVQALAFLGFQRQYFTFHLGGELDQLLGLGVAAEAHGALHRFGRVVFSQYREQGLLGLVGLCGVALSGVVAILFGAQAAEHPDQQQQGNQASQAPGSEKAGASGSGFRAHQ